MDNMDCLPPLLLSLKLSPRQTIEISSDTSPTDCTKQYSLGDRRSGKSTMAEEQITDMDV